MRKVKGQSVKERVAKDEMLSKMIRLKLSGLPWDAIAKETGYACGPTACRFFSLEMKRRELETPMEWKVITSDRLETLFSVCWPKALQGSLPHLEKALRVLEQLRKLHGLDSPVKHELTGKDGGPVEYNMSREQLFEKARTIGERLLSGSNASGPNDN